MSSQQTIRLSILKSIEDGINRHRKENPDTNIPAGSDNAVGFLLEFYENVQGWGFPLSKRMRERYNRQNIDNKISRMSCDY